MDPLVSDPTGGQPLPKFLLPESVHQANGESEVAEIGASKGKPIVVTLGITRIIEQESLGVSIRVSADGTDWGVDPLVTFPQKFYCGTYSILLDLSGHPDAAYVKAEWQMNRWGRGETKPLFGFYLCVQEAGDDMPAMASGTG